MHRLILVAVGLAFASCAQPHAQAPAGDSRNDLGATGDHVDPKSDPDMTAAEVADLAGVTVDLATGKPPLVAQDLSMPPPPPPPADLSTLPDLTPPPVVTACHPVINEVMVGTTQTGTEEFVEIFNPCTTDVMLDGWHLVYRAASNTNASGGADSNNLYPFVGDKLLAGTYRVLAGSGFTGASNGALSSGVAASAALGLRDAAGKLVDSVAFGSAGGGFMEGQPALAPPVVASPGNSIARIPDGVDTDDNGRDFKRATVPTPGAANH